MVDPSVDRDDFEDMLPAILVESPVPGQRITSPVRLSGSANVFEAQFNSQVSNAKGKVLAEKPVKATSGSGTRGSVLGQAALRCHPLHEGHRERLRHLREGRVDQSTASTSPSG